MSAARLSISTLTREELVDITDDVRELVGAAGITSGTLTLFSLHTTCALTVNEGYDPNVVRDVVVFMRHLVPQHGAFHHAEGNSDAHLKVAFFGPSLTLIIEEGDILLGRWQRIFLAEWDGPRRRTVAAHMMTGGHGI